MVKGRKKYESQKSLIRSGGNQVSSRSSKLYRIYVAAAESRSGGLLASEGGEKERDTENYLREIERTTFAERQPSKFNNGGPSTVYLGGKVLDSCNGLKAGEKRKAEGKEVGGNPWSGGS